MNQDTRPAQGEAPQPPQFRRMGVSLGKVLGFPLRLSPSWFIMAALIVFTWGPARADLGVAVGYALSVGLALSLLISVLLHELGHALVARRLGIGVRGITLDLLGGYTEVEAEARKPLAELAFSLAGPAVSLVLGLGSGALAIMLHRDGVADQSPAFFLVAQVAFSNIIVAVYNALPGLPLDGGRALRAAVWAFGGDKNKGTLVAGWAGRVVAALTVVLAFVLFTAGWYSSTGIIIAALIAFSLWQGATASISQAQVVSRFPMIDPVSLARPLFIVPTGTSLAEAVRRAAEQGRPAAALGVADGAGNLVALVKRDAAAAVPEQRRPWISVETLARDIHSVGIIPANLRGEEVIKAVQQHPADEFLVTTGEDVVGVLHLADLVQLLDPRTSRSRL
jgi:Zn-dependent protease